MHKSRKGYSLIETTVGILLISMAAIIIITGAKAGLVGYKEGRSIHSVNEKLMESVEKDKGIKDVVTRTETIEDILTKNRWRFEGVYKTYTDTKTGMTYKTFE